MKLVRLLLNTSFYCMRNKSLLFVRSLVFNQTACPLSWVLGNLPSQPVFPVPAPVQTAHTFSSCRLHRLDIASLLPVNLRPACSEFVHMYFSDPGTRIPALTQCQVFQASGTNSYLGRFCFFLLRYLFPVSSGKRNLSMRVTDAWIIWFVALVSVPEHPEDLLWSPNLSLLTTAACFGER